MTAPNVQVNPAGTPPPRDRQLTAAQLAQILTLVQAQAAVRHRLTGTAVAAVTAQVRAFTDWWSGAAVTALIARILRVVQPSQTLLARSTDAYLARVLGVMLGQRVPPVGAVDVTKLRTALPERLVEELATGRIHPGVVELGDTHTGPAATINDPLPPLSRTPLPALDPAVPYGRLADSYRYQVVAGRVSPDKAQAKAALRAEQVVQTDLMLANRAQEQRFYTRLADRHDITGYRRVLHPEAGAGGPPCGLCVVAADRIYQVEHLKDIHDRCRCETVPIVAGADPGLTLNRDDLNAIYQAAGGTAGALLKKIRVGVAMHGELGPVLVDMAQRYRGPVQVAKATTPDRRIRARAQLDALEESLGALQTRVARGERGLSGAVDWQEHKIGELERELAALGA